MCSRRIRARSSAVISASSTRLLTPRATAGSAAAGQGGRSRRDGVPGPELLRLVYVLKVGTQRLADQLRAVSDDDQDTPGARAAAGVHGIAGHRLPEQPVDGLREAGLHPGAL